MELLRAYVVQPVESHVVDTNAVGVDGEPAAVVQVASLYDWTE